MHEYDDDRTYQFVLNLFLVASSRSRTEVSDGMVSIDSADLMAGAQKSVVVLSKKEVTKS